MVKKRNLWLVALFSVATFGIYMIYWLYATRKEIISVNGNPKSIPRVIILFTPILALVLILILSLAAGGQARTGTALMLLSASAFIPVFLAVGIWWFYRYNKAAAAVSAQDFGAMFLIWILCSVFGVPLIWQLVTQYKFNKAAESQPPQPPAPAAGSTGLPPATAGTPPGYTPGIQ